jgi:hypothetical protein
VSIDLIEAGLNEAAVVFGIMGIVATACRRDCSFDGFATDAKRCLAQEDFAYPVLRARNRSDLFGGQLLNQYRGNRWA